MNIAKWAIRSHIARHIEKLLSIPKEFADTKAIQHAAEAVRQIANERSFTQEQRYELLYEVNRHVIPEFVIADNGRYLLKDAEFRAYFERFSADNWKSFERRWNVRAFLGLLPDVEGHLAECGVFEGGNAYQLCRFAREHGREVHLFDSFEGLSPPESTDGDFWKKGDFVAAEELVHRNLAEFDCFRTFKGWIPGAFPQVAEQSYAFVHIDVDLEQPTRDSIVFFYPRMNPGGIILLDDHGFDTCPGARKAVLEFMADKPEPVIDMASGQGLIIRK